MQTRTSYANAGNFTVPFPFPKPYDEGLCYYVLAPTNSMSFGISQQQNLHIARIRSALTALPESDVELFRALVKAFLRYGKLATIFRLFIAYREGTPQVEAASMRYFDVDNPDAAAGEVALEVDWSRFNLGLRGRL